jgi:hypothetical protein
MLFGIALIMVGAVVLFVMRRSWWPLRSTPGSAEEPNEEARWEERADFETDPFEIDPEYGARPIYVPPERGTVYVSGTRDGP